MEIIFGQQNYKIQTESKGCIYIEFHLSYVALQITIHIYRTGTWVQRTVPVHIYIHEVHTVPTVCYIWRTGRSRKRRLARAMLSCIDLHTYNRIEFDDSWLFYPFADCPPHGWSSMDEPPYELSTVMFIHQNGSTTTFRMV